MVERAAQFEQLEFLDLSGLRRRFETDLDRDLFVAQVGLQLHDETDVGARIVRQHPVVEVAETLARAAQAAVLAHQRLHVVAGEAQRGGLDDAVALFALARQLAAEGDVHAVLVDAVHLRLAALEPDVAHAVDAAALDAARPVHPHLRVLQRHRLAEVLRHLDGVGLVGDDAERTVVRPRAGDKMVEIGARNAAVLFEERRLQQLGNPRFFHARDVKALLHVQPDAAVAVAACRFGGGDQVRAAENARGHDRVHGESAVFEAHAPLVGVDVLHHRQRLARRSEVDARLLADRCRECLHPHAFDEELKAVLVAIVPETVVAEQLRQRPEQRHRLRLVTHEDIGVFRDGADPAAEVDVVAEVPFAAREDEAAVLAEDVVAVGKRAADAGVELARQRAHPFPVVQEDFLQLPQQPLRRQDVVVRQAVERVVEQVAEVVRAGVERRDADAVELVEDRRDVLDLQVAQDDLRTGGDVDVVLAAVAGDLADGDGLGVVHLAAGNAHAHHEAARRRRAVEDAEAFEEVVDVLFGDAFVAGFGVLHDLFGSFLRRLERLGLLDLVDFFAARFVRFRECVDH